MGLGDGAEFCDDSRVIGGEVVVFAGIAAEVVEQRRRMDLRGWWAEGFFGLEVGFPLADSDGEEFFALVVEERLCGQRFVLEERRGRGRG